MNKNKKKAIISALLVLFSIWLVLSFFQKKILSQESTEARWINISYVDLLDENTVLRTGHTLKSAVSDPNLRGAVQPYVDQYSFLLDHATEMIYGPQPLPHHNVVDHFPKGSKQPTWVAIFRGGRICVNPDNKKSARVFLMGLDPKTAYEQNYSVIRHCLRGLLPDDGTDLSVAVYAYKNNYPKSEFELNLNPYRIRSSTFPRPAGSVPVDLIGMKNFFFEGGQLEGALLDRKDGLVLYAKKGGIQTIARHPVSYSDFAAAYRAAFHAGDNPAFVSLDPNPDPTKATISFGGFLENTRIGSVVLEADKRFKTISTGLDPNSFEDVRVNTRGFVPTFFTVSERDLVPQSSTSSKKWTATRFWFYPDSIELETDMNYEYVKIVKAQFMADAERSRADFASKEEFEKLKKATLSPSIQKSIEHLNKNYSQYSNIYPELRELTSVSRIIGICSWLQKAKPSWLDLDSLLSIDLPEMRTETEKTRMMAVTYVSYLSSESLKGDYVRKNSKVVFLSTVLDKTVQEYFTDWIDAAEFLCFKSNLDRKFYRQFENEAKSFLADNMGKKVRELMKTQKDLSALTDLAASKVDISSPRLIIALIADMNSDREELKNIMAGIDEIKEKLKTVTGDEKTVLSKEYNDLVKQYNGLVASLNRDQEVVKQFQVRRPVTVRITGGVELGSEFFNIKQVESSNTLQQFKEISKETEAEWSEVKDTGQWIKSSTGQGFAFKNDIPKYDWTSQTTAQSGNQEFSHLSASDKQNYWISKESRTGNWKDMLQLDQSFYRERQFDAAKKTLRIDVYKDGKVERSIIGRIVENNKIAFSKYSGVDLTPPIKQPKWWIK